MQIKLHKNARTTLALRQEIKNSNETVNALSKKFHLSWNTVNKWKEAAALEDKSSCLHNLNTTLTDKQEADFVFVYIFFTHKNLSSQTV